MRKRCAIAASFVLVLLTVLSQGGQGIASAAPRPVWPAHYPSLAPVGAPASQAKIQNMGASTKGTVDAAVDEAVSAVADAAAAIAEVMDVIDGIFGGSGGATSGTLGGASPTTPGAPGAAPATSPSTGKGPAAEGSLSAATGGNFRLDVGSLDSANVIRTSWTKDGRLTVTLPITDLESWRSWHDTHLTEGMGGRALDGTLTVLKDDMQTETGEIEFYGLTPTSLSIDPQTANSDTIATFTMTLQAEQMKLRTPTTGGSVPVVPRIEIPDWLRNLVSDARGAGVSDAAIHGALTDELVAADLSDPISAAAAMLALDERFAVEKLFAGGAVDLTDSPFAIGGPSGGGAHGLVEAIITSIGGSTGDVLDLYLVNNGKVPASIDFVGAVLEPIEEPSEADLARIQEVMAAASAGKSQRDEALLPLVGGLAGPPGGLLLLAAPASWLPAAPAPWLSAARPALEAPQLAVTRVPLEAYCLEFEAAVPTEGVLFRIAPREVQQAAAPMRALLTASSDLNDDGALNPDSDPVAYYHSIRQWAVWVDERDLDREQYEETFVEHTRKNFEAAGQAWASDVEELVRSLVPNRWDDIQRIFAAADRTAADRGAAERGAEDLGAADRSTVDRGPAR